MFHYKVWTDHGKCALKTAHKLHGLKDAKNICEKKFPYKVRAYTAINILQYWILKKGEGQ